MLGCYPATVTYEALLSEAMALPDEQRAALVKHLAASLSSEIAQVESAWTEEVSSRVDALRAEQLRTVHAEEALSRVEALLRTRRA